MRSRRILSLYNLFYELQCVTSSNFSFFVTWWRPGNRCRNMLSP